MLVCYDVETTGLPEWKLPSEHPSQPHIVQLAAILRTRDRKQEPVKIINRIVKPDGWEIPSEISALHGITTERANDEGVPIRDVLEEFMGVVLESVASGEPRLIGFSLGFDKRLVRIEEKRLMPESADDDLAIGFAFTKMEEIDVCPKMTRHCNLAPSDKMMAAGRKTAKAPKLSEAFAHVYPGREAELQGKMHDALTDIKATMALYWWLVDQGDITP